MKRSASHISSNPESPVESDDFKPDITTSSPTAASASKVKPSSKKNTHTPLLFLTSLSDSSFTLGFFGVGAFFGVWTEDKRSKLMAMVLDAGYKQMNLDSLATELDLAKQQIINQFAPSRKGGLRDRAIQAVRGDK